jgi:hypothetical protein
MVISPSNTSRPMTMRTEITTVMEGGEKAFRLRKERYGF